MIILEQLEGKKYFRFMSGEAAADSDADLIFVTNISQVMDVLYKLQQSDWEIIGAEKVEWMHWPDGGEAGTGYLHVYLGDEFDPELHMRRWVEIFYLQIVADLAPGVTQMVTLVSSSQDEE